MPYTQRTSLKYSYSMLRAEKLFFLTERPENFNPFWVFSSLSLMSYNTTPSLSLDIVVSLCICSPMYTLVRSEMQNAF